MSREKLQKISLVLLGLSSLALIIFLLLPKKEKSVSVLPPSNVPVASPSPSSSESATPTPFKVAVPKVSFTEKEEAIWRNENTRVDVNLESDNLDKVRPIYTRKTTNTDLTNSKAKDMAKTFGFLDLPEETSGPDGIKWTWEQGSKALSLVFSTRKIHYLVDSVQDESMLSPGVNIVESEAKSAGIEFLQQKGLLGTYIDTQNPTFNYFGNEDLQTDRPSPTSKEIAQIKFPLKLDDTPLLIDRPSENFVLVTVTSKNVVIGLKMKLYDAVWEKWQNVGLTGVDKAIETVKSGGGVLVENEGNTLFSQTLASFNLTNASLAYYGSNKDASYLQPVYVFEGEGMLEDLQKTKVIVYTTAVDY